MKMIVFITVYFAFPLVVLCQTSSRSVNSLKSTAEDNKLDLNKYIWSHSHYGKNSKPPIDFNVIDSSFMLGSQVSITSNGEYFSYCVNRGVGIDSVVVQSTHFNWRKALKSYYFGFFSGDGKKYVFRISGGLYVSILGTDEGYYIRDVKSYKFLKGENNEWFAYCLNNNELVLKNLYTENEKHFPNVSSYDFDPSGKWLIVNSGENNKGSKQILIFDIKRNKERTFSGVKEYMFNSTGKSLLLKVKKDNSQSIATELQFCDLINDSLYIIFSPEKESNAQEIKTCCISSSGMQVAFIIETTLEKEVMRTIWYWRLGWDRPKIGFNDPESAMERFVPCLYDFSFSDNGRYILFRVQKIPNDTPLLMSSVPMDIWSYKDKKFRFSERNNKQRDYKSLINIETGKVVQLEKEYEKIRSIQGDYAIVSKSGSDIYADRFWEPGYNLDSNWLIVLREGSKKLLPVMDRRSKLYFSPGGRYLLLADWYGDWFSYHLYSGRLRNITRKKLAPRKEEFISYIAQWLSGDSTVWIYDNYDICELDLKGEKLPVNLTNRYGQKKDIIFSLINSAYGERLNNEISTYLGKDTLLLRAFNKMNKYNGFYRKVLGRPGDPDSLLMEPCFITRPVIQTSGMDGGMVPLKAGKANVWIVKKQTPNNAPNYYVTRDFKNYQCLTYQQPHTNYNWLTTELHKFKQLDGSISQAVLYKPENFDPRKKYPVIITFYTDLSDRLYQYPYPSYLDQPSIFDRPSWMVSHGYLVFTPDIHFGKQGWGPSVVKAIDGAAKYLGGLPFVDKKHMGAAGHSNSGRFGYYLYTHSNSFAAIALGSGSGGIDLMGVALTEGDWLEWAEESAVGGGLGNLWRNKVRWIDHIGLLQLDKVKSPLLCFFNKKDWFDARQAEELMIGLRRLDKKAWWLQYDNGEHIFPTKRFPEMKDFTIRYTQFFDHYLKGAPAPSWMTMSDFSALQSGESRYELDTVGHCSIKCSICKEKKWHINYK